jgi:hypothetical protein
VRGRKDLAQSRIRELVEVDRAAAKAARRARQRAAEQALVAALSERRGQSAGGQVRLCSRAFVGCDSRG